MQRLLPLAWILLLAESLVAAQDCKCVLPSILEPRNTANPLDRSAPLRPMLAFD